MRIPSRPGPDDRGLGRPGRGGGLPPIPGPVGGMKTLAIANVSMSFPPRP